MATTVRVPTPLRMLTAGKGEIALDVGDTTVGALIDHLEADHPGFRDKLVDENGGLKRFVNVFVADDDIRYLSGLDTPVPAGETVSILAAVAGG